MNTGQNSTRDILADRRAYSVFLFAAWWMIPLASVIAVALVWNQTLFLSGSGVLFRVLAGCIGAVGAVAAIVLFLGMLAYLLILDRASWKLLWLVIFLFTGAFGSAAYFFLVYRKQVDART